MQKTYLIKDVNNNIVCINELDLYTSLQEQNINIFGLTMEHIINLKYLYDMLGGIYPITKESVKVLCPNV